MKLAEKRAKKAKLLKSLTKARLKRMYIKNKMSISTMSIMLGLRHKTIKDLLEKKGIKQREKGSAWR